MKEEMKDALALWRNYEALGWTETMKCPECGSPLLIKTIGGDGSIWINIANESGHMYGTCADDCGNYNGNDKKCNPEGEGDFEEGLSSYEKDCPNRTYFVASDDDFFFCLRGHRFKVIEEFNGWYDQCEPGEEMEPVDSSTLKKGEEEFQKWGKWIAELKALANLL